MSSFSGIAVVAAAVATLLGGAASQAGTVVAPGSVFGLADFVVVVGGLAVFGDTFEDRSRSSPPTSELIDVDGTIVTESAVEVVRHAAGLELTPRRVLP